MLQTLQGQYYVSVAFVSVCRIPSEGPHTPFVCKPRHDKTDILRRYRGNYSKNTRDHHHQENIEAVQV